MRGCSKCNYSAELWLPEIEKKIIYVDQCFFSSAFRGDDNRFSEIIDKLKFLSDMQLVAMPFSSLHMDETYQWRGHNDHTKENLMEFIKHIACGHEFIPDYKIEERQVIKSFKDFLAGKNPDSSVIVKDAIEGNIHEWNSYLRIDVNYYPKDINLVRESKKQAVDLLMSTIDQWRISKDSFDESVELETNDAARNYIRAYFAYMERVGNGELLAHLTSPIHSMMIEKLMNFIRHENSMHKKHSIIFDFFRSNHFKNVPFIWIKSRLFSQLKHIIKAGAYTNPTTARKKLTGVFQDFSHIATYAPYSDAILVDQPMAELAAAPAVGLEKKFDVNIFSLNDKHLFDWLNSLEENMTQDHKEGLLRAYPNLPKNK